MFATKLINYCTSIIRTRIHNGFEKTNKQTDRKLEQDS